MYRVTVDGVTKEWNDFHFAVADAMTRGWMKEWKMEAVTNLEAS